MARTTKTRTAATGSNGFTPAQLEALSGLVERSTYKKKLEEAKPGTPWFKKLFSFLSTGETSSSVYAALEGKNPAEEYGKNLIRDIRGMGYEDKTYADVLEKVGMPKLALSEMMPWAYSDTGQGVKLKKNGFMDITARGVAGLAGDIFLDPKTYLTFGGSAIAKISNLTKEGKAVKSLAQSQIDDVIKLGGDDMIDVVNKINLDTEKLLKSNKDLYLTGLKFMGKEIVPRAKVLAPGRYLDSTFQHIPVLNQIYGGAKSGVQDVFKYGADILRKGKDAGEVGSQTAETYVALKQALPKRQKELIAKTYASLKELHKVFKKEVPNGTRDDFGRMIYKKMEGAIDDLGIAPEGKGEFIDNLVNSFQEFNTGFLAGENKSIGALNKDPLEAITNYVARITTKEGNDWLAKQKKLSFQGRAISTGANSDKERLYSKFVDEKTGEEIVAKPRAMGWLPFKREVEANAITDRVLPMVARREKEISKLQTALKNLNIKGLKTSLKTTKVELPGKVATLKTTPKTIKLGTAELKNRETAKYINNLISLPNKDVKRINKLIGTREKWAGDLWKEIQDLATEAQTKVAALPDADMWWKDADGNILKRSGIATADEVEEIMKKEGFKGQFFERDPFAITYGRGAMSAKKIAANEFYNNVSDSFGIKGTVYDEPWRNPDTRKMTTKKAIMEDTVDGIRYVDPSGEGRGLTMFPEGTLLPDFIVADLQKTKKLFDDEEVGNKLLQGYDKIINEWKGSVYGWYPASHGRNLIGALYNNWLAGMKPFDPAYKQGMEIVRGADGFVTTNAGLKIPYKVVRDQILAKGVVGQSGMLDAVRFYKEFDPNKFKQFRNFPVTAMEAVENSVRTPLFVKALKEGSSFDDAAKQVFKYHFDYAPEALSTFEKQVLRRFIPFYRWTRGNIPLQLEQMIAQPGKFGATFKALQQASDKDGRVQMDLLPGYTQNDINISRGGQTVNGLGIPPVQMFQYMKEPINQFLSGLTPFVKIPVELKTGFNTFKEKAILDDDSGKFADNYPQPVKDWLQYDQKEVIKKDGTKFTITTVDPMRKYWLYALPTGRLASIFSSTMGEDEKNKLLYNISGIKSFEYDMQRLKDTQESNFEKAIVDILVGEGIMGEMPYIFSGSKEEAGLAAPKKRTKRSDKK